MKRILLFFVISLISLVSCIKKEDTIINIKVLQMGSPTSGETVYLFSERKNPNTLFFTPFHSDKQVITESNGVASFELNKIIDLYARDSQTTFYFGVFKNNVLLGKTATTIKKGQEKNVTLNIY